MLTIRTANDADSASISALMSALGYDVDGAEVANRISEIRARGGELFVAENEKNGAKENGAKDVVGCVHMLVDFRLAEGRNIEVVSLVVGENARGLGVGKALMAQAERWARAQGSASLRVRANAIRHASHEFYNRLGFQEIKTQKVFQARF